MIWVWFGLVWRDQLGISIALCYGYATLDTFIFDLPNHPSIHPSIRLHLRLVKVSETCK